MTQREIERKGGKAHWVTDESERRVAERHRAGARQRDREQGM